MITYFCLNITCDDPEDDGVAEDGGDEDGGEAQGPEHLVQPPHPGPGTPSQRR